MRKRLLLAGLLCTMGINTLMAQISNTETTITLTSTLNMSCHPRRVHPQFDFMPSSSPSNVYQMYIEFIHWDNPGIMTRMPASGYYNCTVTNTFTANGPVISIDVPGAVFPTVDNTVLMWDFMYTLGKVYLVNTSTNTTYSQNWEYDQFYCTW